MNWSSFERRLHLMPLWSEAAACVPTFRDFRVAFRFADRRSIDEFPMFARLARDSGRLGPGVHDHERGCAEPVGCEPRVGFRKIRIRANQAAGHSNGDLAEAGRYGSRSLTGSPSPVLHLWRASPGRIRMAGPSATHPSFGPEPAESSPFLLPSSRPRLPRPSLPLTAL